MDVLRVETGHLFTPLLDDLCSLLGDLSQVDWSRPTACPGWSVHDVASHLLGVEIGNVSVRRDGWCVEPGPGEALNPWLNAFNNQWVEACQRVSPNLLIALMGFAGAEFNRHVGSLDLDILGGPVLWAGDDPAPVWLDVAREFMERATHQQQIRWATSRPSLRSEFLAAVVRTAVHALPVALAGQQRPSGATVAFTVDGDAGGTWYIVSDGHRWTLDTGPGGALKCEVRMESAEDALKLCVRDEAAPHLTGTGEPDLIAAVGRMKSVLG